MFLQARLPKEIHGFETFQNKDSLVRSRAGALSPRWTPTMLGTPGVLTELQRMKQAEYSFGRRFLVPRFLPSRYIHVKQN